MVKLEDLKPGMPLVGLEPFGVATIAVKVPIGVGTVQVFYRTPDGTTKQRLLGRADVRLVGIDGIRGQTALCCFAKGIRNSGSSERFATFRHRSPMEGPI